ncbi:MAG: DnaB-like helicase C-terminal domain-containing protein [Firmicutes bacterium]|jgi:replicative DNA helicase|nr:DnaB-like helicase C-terminal domain-containing protein [Bacillota bacterium]
MSCLTQAENLNAEKALLTAAASSAAALAFLRYRLQAKDFSDERNRAIWKTLNATGKLPEEFEPAVDVPQFEDLGDLYRKVKAESGLREARRLCESALRALQRNPRIQPEKFLERFVQSAAKIIVPGDASPVKSPEEWLEGAFKAINARHGGGPMILDLGLERLTRAVSAEPGHLILLAAETGKGKTATALNIASHLGVVQGTPTLYINTEMSWEELAIRLYAMLGDANLLALRTGTATDSDMKKVEHVRNTRNVGNALYISDAMPWLSHGEMEALAREYAALVGVKALVVDYIQRLDIEHPEEESWELLLRACKRLKSLAQELSMFVIVLAQLAEPDRLAGSRGMLREADVALFIEEESDQSQASTHRIRVVKARHSPSGGVIRLYLDRASLKMYEVSTLDELGEGQPDSKGERRRRRKRRSTGSHAGETGDDSQPEDNPGMQESIL